MIDSNRKETEERKRGSVARSQTMKLFFDLLLGIVFVARTQSLFFDEGPQQKSKAAFLKLWFALYAFVGTQLAWTLRPFFGAPGLRFEIFRGLGGNFYNGHNQIYRAHPWTALNPVFDRGIERAP